MILVTGGTGFVGRRLVAALAGRGSAVRVLTRTRDRGTGFPTGVDVALGDLLDSSSLEHALRGVVAIVHLAARHDAGGAVNETLSRVNVTGTERLIAAAKAHDVRVMVHVSSAAVYGMGDLREPHVETMLPTPASSYGRSKLEGEQVVIRMLVDSRTRWAILRPTDIFGPGRAAACRLYRRIRRRKVWVHAGPSAIVHPVYVDDVTRCIVASLDLEGVNGAILNVAGERAIPFAELLAMISRILGTHLRQLQVPTVLTRPMARGIVGLCSAVGFSPTFRLSRLAWHTDNQALDISRARQVLGFTPSSLESAIRETAEWCGRQGLS